MARCEKTALITGSGQKIGRGIAIRLAEAGFNIILNGSKNRDACEAVAKEVEAIGPDTAIAMGDIGVKEDCENIIKTGQEAFGTVDALILNAAIRPHGPFLEIDDDAFQHVMDVNLYSAFWMTRMALPGMMEKGWGRIVTFTGMNAQRGYPGATAVSVSKHGLWGMTKGLAIEFGQNGVTSNIISPGTFPGDDYDLSKDERRTRLKNENPVRRLGLTTDIGGLVSFLCSEDGGFMNGQMLQCNGGAVVQY